MNRYRLQWFNKTWKNNKKWFAVILCLVGSFFFLAFQGGKLSFILFVVVVILIIYFVLGRFSGIGTANGVRHVPLHGKQGVEAGASVPITIDVQLRSLWFYPYVIIQDRLVNHLGEYTDFECTFIPDWRSRGQIQYETPPLSRGLYHFENTVCITEDIFGLFQHQSKLKLNHEFYVYPRMIEIKDWSYFHTLTQGHHHRSISMARQETTQINGVRDYIYGDRISRIHWNATARTGTWKSKEFEKETLPKTVIVLDRASNAYQDSSTFELAVSVTASLFRFGLYQDIAFGLLSAGKDMTRFDTSRGEIHFNQVLHHLTVVSSDGNHALLQVLKIQENWLNKDDLLIFVSPRSHQDMKDVLGWVHARHLHACHMWVQASEFGSSDVSQKQIRSSGQIYGISKLQELPDLLRRGAR